MFSDSPHYRIDGFLLNYLKRDIFPLPFFFPLPAACLLAQGDVGWIPHWCRCRRNELFCKIIVVLADRPDLTQNYSRLDCVEHWALVGMYWTLLHCGKASIARLPIRA